VKANSIELAREIEVEYEVLEKFKDCTEIKNCEKYAKVSFK